MPEAEGPADLAVLLISESPAPETPARKKTRKRSASRRFSKTCRVPQKTAENIWLEPLRERVRTLNMSQLAKWARIVRIDSSSLSYELSGCYWFWPFLSHFFPKHRPSQEHSSMGFQAQSWWFPGFPPSTWRAQEDQGRWMVRDRWRGPPHCLEGALFVALEVFPERSGSSVRQLWLIDVWYW